LFVARRGIRGKKQGILGLTRGGGKSPQNEGYHLKHVAPWQTVNLWETKSAEEPIQTNWYGRTHFGGTASLSKYEVMAGGANADLTTRQRVEERMERLQESGGVRQKEDSG